MNAPNSGIIVFILTRWRLNTMIFGKIGETEGEKLVYKSLSSLSDDWLVYSQPTIVSDKVNRYPDFVVIHEDIGLLVIEVKDWLVVSNYDGESATVRLLANSIDQQQESPVEQARQACFTIQDELLKYPELRDNQSKLLFPWRFAGVLPKLQRYKLDELRRSWGRFQLFGLPDFSDGNVEVTLRSVPAPFTRKLTKRQIDIIRTVIDGSLRIGENGIYDITQESLAKEEIRKKRADDSQSIRLTLSFNLPTRLENSENNIPNEVVDFSKTKSVRLIRGTAGTGKTDVILLRCHYLTEIHPHDNVLVTTFNIPISETRIEPILRNLSPTVQFKRFSQICQEIYKAKFGQWTDPQNTQGVVNAIFEREPHFDYIKDEYGPSFLVDEIQYIKEMNLTSKDLYISTIREGRGGGEGRSLSQNQKELIYDFFLTYQDYLNNLPAIDWNDLYHRALKYIQTGEVVYQKYDEILIDEAQHFAPKWIELMVSLLKDNGKLFLCEDPTQSVYRSYSWKQKGVDVRGRTKWLRIPYRSTRQILRSAYSLIENNQTVIKLLSESGEFELPNLDSDNLRDGSIPELHHFNTWIAQRNYIKRKINALVELGYHPAEIAILHTKSYVLDAFEECEKAGVIVDEVRRETGMEYKIVFLPKLSDFLTKSDLDDKYGVEKNQSDLYTAITRAKDLVFLSNEKKLPKELTPILTFVQEFTHEE